MNTQEQSFFDKFNTWMRNSLTIRIISIGFLILILLIPTLMVQDLIRERKYRNDEARQEVGSVWGQVQTLSGPIVSVPYKKHYVNEKNEVYTQTEYAHFLPEELDIEGEILPEQRHRGIYNVVVYTAKLRFSGTFKGFNFADWKIDNDEILWDKAFVSFGIPDMRGIKQSIQLQWNDSLFSFNPGVETSDVIASGISADIDLSKNRDAMKKFNFDLELRGSEELFFVPLGKNTTVHIQSDWPSPSFRGAFLPDSSNITNKQFVADWKVLHLNRNYPQQWLGNQYHVADAAFGVSLLIPVDHYQKSTRSAKYAIMIIAFTFLVFFFVEVLNKTRIHPIQYLLVGLALIIFYSLLLAISEHLSFNIAYLISSIATISLVAFYAHSIFKKASLTRIAVLTLILLYGFIFVILQLEDYALLMGSIGLFVVMAVIMYLSRKINWYNFKNDKSE